MEGKDGFVDHDELSLNVATLSNQCLNSKDGLYSQHFNVGPDSPPVDRLTLARVAFTLEIALAPYLLLFEICGFRLGLRSVQEAKNSRVLFKRTEYEMSAKLSHRSGQHAVASIILSVVLFSIKLAIALLFIVKYA